MSEQVPVPARVMALNLLDRVDYADAFIAKNVPSHTPEEWARIIVHNASPLVREFVFRAHQILRLRVERSDSPEELMGWTIRHRGPHECVLGTEGALVTPRIVVTTPQGQLLVATLLRYDHVSARPIWTVIAPIHRAVARYLLPNAAHVAGTQDPPNVPQRDQGVEGELVSIVQRKALTPNDFATLPELARYLMDFGQHYRTIARPFEWTFTRAKLDSVIEKITQPEPRQRALAA